MSSTENTTTAGSQKGLNPFFTVLLWLGVATVFFSFLVLAYVLVLYFMSATPPTWTFTVILFAFPIGFLFMLIYLVAAASARRRANTSLHTN